MKSSDLELILVDPIAELYEQWQLKFEGQSQVEIINGRFEDLPHYDCMVSAGNSFGLMDGGVDGAITCQNAIGAGGD